MASLLGLNGVVDGRMLRLGRRLDDDMWQSSDGTDGRRVVVVVVYPRATFVLHSPLASLNDGKKKVQRARRLCLSSPRSPFPGYSGNFSKSSPATQQPPQRQRF
ncbi:unnamed protein product [Heligmosomoides polygyrus]|uniref:Uncharacterized protein n=1 Tax=Heligmosomoides polygyrus TaxID=6339 RepID=A0A183FJP3_HELPZ|nr:unnamed protein product [Heligmosomoides polygyrus]